MRKEFLDLDMIPEWVKIDSPRFRTKEIEYIEQGESKRYRGPKMHPVKVIDPDGSFVVYQNVNDCAEKLDYCPSTIRKYIRGTKKHPVKKFEFVDKEMEGSDDE